MRWIVGLGNPGAAYARTRHNIGWMALDVLAQEAGAKWKEAKAHQGLLAYGRLSGVEVAFIKPLTYMNLSGVCVASILRKERWSIDEGLVLVDDMDTSLGTVRLRLQGGHGGHNGLRSLIAELHTSQFSRVRMGISRPAFGAPFADYVLDRFPEHEEPLRQQTVARACQAVHWAIELPMEQAMARCNQSG